MKRCWFGAGLLIVLLIASLAVTWCMEEIHEPIAAQLNRAAALAELGSWDEAEACSRRAEVSWEKWEHFRGCFADHNPTEEVNTELAAMAAARKQRQKVAFAACCVRAAEMVQAVGDAHGLYWWNLL